MIGHRKSQSSSTFSGVSKARIVGLLPMEVLVSMYIWHTLTRRSHCGPQRTFYSSSQRSRGRSTKSICSNVSVSLTDTTTPCPRTICGNAHISPRMGAYKEAIDTEARGRDATYSLTISRTSKLWSLRRSVRLLQDRCPGARGLHSRRRLRSHS